MRDSPVPTELRSLMVCIGARLRHSFRILSVDFKVLVQASCKACFIGFG